jgi:putative endonuclease
VRGARGIAGGDPARRALGARGERIAIRHLRTKGLRVIGRNIVRSAGEIDLLCRDRDGVLVVVEVKSRIVDPAIPAPPAEAAITSAKRTKLLALARDIARRHRVDPRRVRIDVVAVEFGPGRTVEVRHHPRAVTERSRGA